MNIAVVAADMLPGKLGGAETHIVETVKRLSKKHSFFLFVGADAAISKEFSGNVKVFPVKYPKISNLYGLAYILFAYSHTVKIIEKNKIDIIWAKEVFPQGILAALLARKLKKPLYMTTQNPKLHYEELYIKGRFLQPFHKILADSIDPLISWSITQANVIAAVSSYSANIARKMKAKKVIVIPNGVDPLKFNLKRSKPRKQFRIVTVSSLIPRNGIDTLIVACSLLPADLNWKLQIAGDGPELYSLQQLVRKNHINEKVEFLGQLANDAIPKFLSQADIFIRPSRKEGFGISFLEAMAAGLPVIATAIGGITDFVKQEETGILIKPNAPQQVTAAILQILRNRRFKWMLIKNAKKIVQNEYTWDNIADEIDQVFIKLS